MLLQGDSGRYGGESCPLHKPLWSDAVIARGGWKAPGLDDRRHDVCAFDHGNADNDLTTVTRPRVNSFAAFAWRRPAKRDHHEAADQSGHDRKQRSAARERVSPVPHHTPPSRVSSEFEELTRL